MKIIDLHSDTVSKIQAGANIFSGDNCDHVNLSRLNNGNVSIQVFANFVSSAFPRGRAWQEVNELIDLCHHTCVEFSDHLEKIETLSQAIESINSQKIGIILSVENDHVIENELSNLENYD